MPELPDVEMFRKEAEKCKHSEIISFVKSDARFVKFSDNDFNKSLKGKKFNQVMRRGKYLFLIAGKDAALVMHFGMTGSLMCLEKDEKEPPYTRCSIGFKSTHILHVLSRRKLGYVDLTEHVDEWIKDKDLGPDALEIKRDEFTSALKNRKSMIKAVLTDQAVVAGVGNEYADEILYQSRIHPGENSGRIPEKELNRLFEVMQQVFKTAVANDADVSKLPEHFLLPVRSKGRNCPSCSGKIETTKISGRTTYFCPSCQKSLHK